MLRRLIAVLLVSIFAIQTYAQTPPVVSHEVFVQVRIMVTDADTGDIYRDALTYPWSDFAGLTITQRNTKVRDDARARYAAWKIKKAEMSAPKPPLTREEKLARLAAIRAQLEEIKAQEAAAAADADAP